MYVLLIDHEDDYDPPAVHGPFDTLVEGQEYAERWRAQNGLPIEATQENNEDWTNLGWYFGLFQPTKEV